MPAVPLFFRVKCGAFVGTFISFMFRRTRKFKPRTLFLKTRAAGVTLGLLLVQLFFCDLLQQCGDIESNPGPPKVDQQRQTRLNSKGEVDRRDSMGKKTEDAAAEPTLKDVMSKLSSMDSKFDKRFDLLKEEVMAACAEMKEEVRVLKEEVTSLHQENESLRQENQDVKRRLDNMSLKLDDLEGRSRRNNLLFYGLERKEDETNQDCEQAVQQLLSSKMGLRQPVAFDRVHRVSNKKDSPIIARCTFYKDRTDILRGKLKLKGTDVFVGEDFSPRVRDIRKALYPHCKEARRNDKRATVIFDHLVIDGKKFVLDSDGEGIVEEVRDRRR